MGPLRQSLRDALERGSRCQCPKTAATCLELLARERALWAFTRVEGVEPTNNSAERGLRHAVLWRKSSYGTQRHQGSRFVEAILTVVTKSDHTTLGQYRAGIPGGTGLWPVRAARMAALP